MLSIPYINVKSLVGGTQSLDNCLPHVAVSVPVHVLSLTGSVIITYRIKYFKHNKNADLIHMISVTWVFFLGGNWDLYTKDNICAKNALKLKAGPYYDLLADVLTLRWGFTDCLCHIQYRVISQLFIILSMY